MNKWHLLPRACDLCTPKVIRASRKLPLILAADTLFFFLLSSPLWHRAPHIMEDSGLQTHSKALDDIALKKHIINECISWTCRWKLCHYPGRVTTLLWSALQLGERKKNPLLRDLEWTSGTQGWVLPSDYLFIKDAVLRFQEESFQLFSHINLQAMEQVVTGSVEKHFKVLMNGSDERPQTSSVA